MSKAVSFAPETFATDRLEARRIDDSDADFLVAMLADPQVTATLGGPRTEEVARATLDRWMHQWVDRKFGPWILADRSSGARVGWILLAATDTGGAGSVEVGWSVVADRWRQGLATEAGTAAVRIAFTDVGLDALVSFTLPHNVASRGVMEKLGFRYDTDVEHAGLPHVLYRLDRQTWENERG